MLILIIITFLIDYLLSYFIPITFNNLNYFYPMLLIVLIVYLYNKIPRKKYLKTILILGIIYDLLYSYIFLFNTLVFLLFTNIIKKIDKYLRINLLINIIIIILFIFIYDLILFCLIYLTKYNTITFNNLLYKFSHSIILNISYYFLLNIIVNKKIIKKYLNK
ncbi:MAG: rod shape-determining protein MreD [Erysipelotrichaceae bacterium]|nr:rod shape-determining protein MreD [Erysipelotrichaceae bacterium]